jgi:GTP cyclohydrolase I
VGSNIDPEANVERCLLLLSRRVRIRGLSTVYQTPAEGGREQPSYLNCVVEAETGLPPARLKREVLRAIEGELGRTRGDDPYASRPCDLDILLYDELALRTPEVSIPDPHLLERPYLGRAVLELAPEVKLPGGQPLRHAIRGWGAMALVPLPELTARLRKEIVMAVDTVKIEGLIRELLAAIGEDPSREGLRNTPARVARSFAFLASGYGEEVRTTMGSAYFTEQTDSMVIVRDIEMYSLCEHHLLPFYGRCHIGYLAREKVAGCSKLARIVDMFARRLQIQERLTEQISHAVKDALDAAGVGVMIEAHHLCMMMRGVQKQNSKLVTSSLLGVFREPEFRSEFYSLVRREGTP